MDYIKKTNEFAKKHGIKLSIISSEYKSMWGESIRRWVFKCRLSRNRKQYTFEFGQSIAKGNNKPSMHRILACLQKYDTGSFEDFCRECEYSNDSIKAQKTYKAICREYAAVERLFGDIIEDLQEIL